MTLTIGKRLGLGFGAVIALMVLITAIGIREVGKIDRDLTEITDVNAVKQRFAINFRGSVHDRAISLRDVVLHTERAGVQRAVAEIQQLGAFYATSATALDKMFAERTDIESNERDALARIKAIETRTLPLIDRVIQLRLSGSNEQALSLLMQEAAPNFVEWLAQINIFIDLQEAKNQVATERARDTAGDFARLMLALSGFALVLGITIGTLIARSLLRSLGGEPTDAAAMVRSIASGDLSSRIHTKHPESILGAMDGMQRELSGIFREIGSISSDLVRQSEALGRSSREVSHRAREQTASSRQSADNIDRIAASMRDVGEVARQTEDISRKTAELSEAGIGLVESAGAEMGKIAHTVQASSDRINSLRQGSVKISGAAEVIREIADQTNLLALNAAIEAARAGESGRGFAVVADEVRKLAERTSIATREIADVIKIIETDTQKAVEAMATAVPQVGKGLELSEKASLMLADISRQAADSLGQAGEVVRTTDEQTTSIEHLSESFRQVAETAEQVASEVASNVSTAADLERIASVMREHVARFRLSTY